MAKIKIGLNRLRPDNYAFFDPDTRLHLTLDHPQGEVSVMSPGIERGIKTGVIVDIDKILENADASKKPGKEPEKETESGQEAEPIIEESEDLSGQEAELNAEESEDFLGEIPIPKPEKTPKKRGSRKKVAVIDEEI